jgi:hypothetical protein
MNLDGTPEDVSARGNGGIQITADEVKQYLNLNLVYKMNNIMQGTGNKYSRMFRPDSMVVAPAAPTGVSATADAVTWNAVDGAVGYIVARDGSFAGFAESNTYTDPTPGTTYTVYAYNKYGGISYPSGSSETEMTLAEMYEELFAGPADALKHVADGNYAYTFTNGIFRTTETSNLAVYNLYGRCLKVVENAQEVNLQDMPKGLYLIKSVDSANGSRVTKVVL